VLDRVQSSTAFTRYHICCLPPLPDGLVDPPMSLGVRRTSPPAGTDTSRPRAQSGAAETAPLVRAGGRGVRRRNAADADGGGVGRAHHGLLSSLRP
jgi:hypothetical protein